MKSRNIIVTISAGAGGETEYVKLLERMIIKYSQGKKYSCKIAEDEGKQVVISVEGDGSYTSLIPLKGVHRFKLQNKSILIAVDVVPAIRDENIDIDSSQLRIETFRSSGAGGQHVNTTDSGVRITHLPTGITVKCQQERSQYQNRRVAMDILRQRLTEHQNSDREEVLNRLKGDVKHIELGSQIISYVYYPREYVKDHRTGYKTTRVSQMLKGDMQPLIDAYYE